MGIGTVAGVVGATAAVAGAAKSVIGGSGGGGGNNYAGAAQDQEANALAQQASDLWKNLQAPSLNTTPLQQQSWLQDFAPETYSPDQSFNVTQMSDDPAALAAQQQALGQLQALAKGGLSPSDMIALNQLQSSQAGAASSQSAAAADALRQRGLGGAGAELATRLAGNQQAANSASNLYDNAFKTAADRQMQAIGQSGSLAGNMRHESANISNQMANINNQWNTNIMNARTAAAAQAAQIRNAATAANLSGHQGVANQNVAIANQNLDRLNQLAQQNFSNQSAIISGQSNALNRQQTLSQQQAAAASQRATGADQSMLTGMNSLANLGTNISDNVNKSGTWQNTLFGNNNSGNTSSSDMTWDGMPDEATF